MTDTTRRRPASTREKRDIEDDLKNEDQVCTKPPSPSYKRRKKGVHGRKKGFWHIFPQLAVVALIVLGIILLLGFHLYLFRMMVHTTIEFLFLDMEVEPTTAMVENDEADNFIFAAQQADHGLMLTPLRDLDRELYTIRINTWKREEQLMLSIDHHSSCAGVAQIQVVWCDDQGDPPIELIENAKVIIEHHEKNSLNERFHILERTPTLGILSMDDDVLRPCEAIDSGFFRWVQNPNRLVGFDARSHVVGKDGRWSVSASASSLILKGKNIVITYKRTVPFVTKYAYMSVTEKTNRYSLTLPRYCFVHRDYMEWYTNYLPKPMIERVTKNFNCEDIAMSFFVSSLTDGEPPLLADLWAIKSMLKLYSPNRISGQKDHKLLRDDCVDSFAELLGLKDKLSPAIYIHKDKVIHEQQFGCGAEQAVKGRDGSITTARLTNHAMLIEQWRRMSLNEMTKEIGKLRSAMALKAFISGLIEKTEPWQRRWKSVNRQPKDVVGPN